MANNIETNIVEMQFDNKQFEAGAKETLSTLDKLKKSLHFENVKDGFQTIQNGINSVNFGGLTKNVEAIANSFDTLAGRIKVNFFDEISKKIIEVGEQFVNSSIGQIISGGKTRALNIAQAKFKLEGMDVDWDKIYGDIDYAVSGTAYGLDAAASIAAQLTASGVEIGDGMKAALRGVSGVAAMTSSSYEEIGQVFAAVAGQGRVMAMQLNQLSLRGINAAATLAKALGVTESEVREMVSKGQVDFATFAKAMDDAYGEHAMEANKTFTGSMSNINAALSRVGEVFYGPFYERVIDPLNAVRTIIAEVAKALAAGYAEGTGFKASLDNLLISTSKFATLALNKLQPFILKFIDKAMPVLEKQFDHIASGIDTLTSWLDGLVPENTEDDLKKVADGIENITEAEMQAATDIWKKGLYGNGQERIDNLEAAGLRANLVQQYLNKLIETNFDEEKAQKELGIAIADTNEEAETQEKIFKRFNSIKDILTTLANTVKTVAIKVANGISTIYTGLRNFWSRSKDGIMQFVTTVWNALKSVWGAISTIFGSLFDDFGFIFTDLAEILTIILGEIGKVITAFSTAISGSAGDSKIKLSNLTKVILRFVKSIRMTDKDQKNLTDTFRGIIAVGKIFWNVLSSIISVIAKMLGYTDDGDSKILSITGTIGRLLVKFEEWLKKGDKIKTLIAKVTTFIGNMIGVIKSLFDIAAPTWMKDFVEGLGSIKDALVKGDLSTVLTDFKDSVVETCDDIWTNVLGLGDENSGPSNLVKQLSDALDEMSSEDFDTDLFAESLIETWEDYEEKFKTVLDNIKTHFDDFDFDLKEITDSIKETLSGFVDFIDPYLDDILQSIDGSSTTGISTGTAASGAAKYGIFSMLNQQTEQSSEEAEKALTPMQKFMKILSALAGIINRVLITLSIFNTSRGFASFGKAFLQLSKNLKSVTQVLDRFAKAKEFEALAGLIKEIALSLFIFVGIIAITGLLITTNWQLYVLGLEQLVILLAILAGAVALMAGFMKGTNRDLEAVSLAFKGLSKTIASIALTIFAMIAAVAIIAGIANKQGSDKMWSAFSAVLTLVIVFLGLLSGIVAIVTNSKLQNLYGPFKELTQVIIALGGVILIMGVLVAAFSFMADTYDTLTKGVVVVGAIILLIAALIDSMLIAVSRTSNVDKLWTLVASITGLVVALAAIVYIIGTQLNGTEIWDGLKVLGAASVLAFALLAIVTDLMSNAHLGVAQIEAISKLMLAIGVMMGVIGAAIALIVYEFSYSSHTLAPFFTIIGTMAALVTAVHSIVRLVTDEGLTLNDLTIAGIALGVVAAFALLISWAISTVAKAFASSEHVVAPIVAIILSLAAIVAAMYIVSDLANSNAQGLVVGVLALLVAAGVLTSIASAFRDIEDININWDKIWAMVITLGVIIGGLAALGAIGAGTEGIGALAILAAAVAMVIAGAAVLVLAKGLQALDDVDFKKIEKGLKTMLKVAGVLAVFGLVAPFIMLLGAALVVLGLGIAVILLPLLGLIKEFGLLIETFANLGDTWPDTSKVFDDFIDKLGKAIPRLFTAFGEGVAEFCKVIKEKAPIIGEAIQVLFETIINTLYNNRVLIATRFVQFLDVILKLISDHIDSIAESVVNIITSILTYVQTKAYDIGRLFADIVIDIFSGILDVVQERDDEVAMKIVDTIDSILVALAHAIGQGALAKKISEVKDKIVEKIENTFENAKDKLKEIGGGILNKLTEGLSEKWEDLKKFIQDISDWVTEKIDQAKELLKEGADIVNDATGGIGSGITDGAEKAFTAARRLAGGVAWNIADVFKVASPSKWSDWIGEMLDEGLANGITDNTKNVTESAKSLATSAKDSLVDNLDISSLTDKAGEYFGSMFEDFDLSSFTEGISDVGASLKDGLGDSLSGLGDFFNAENLKDSFDFESVKDTFSGITDGIDFDPFAAVGDGEFDLTANLGFSLPDGSSDVNDYLNGKWENSDWMAGFGEDIKAMQDQTQNLNFGEGSTEIAQQTYETIYAEPSDEERAMYTELRDLMLDLRDVLENTVIVSEDVDFVSTIDLDGRTLARGSVKAFEAILQGRYKTAKEGVTQK